MWKPQSMTILAIIHYKLLYILLVTALHLTCSEDLLLQDGSVAVHIPSAPQVRDCEPDSL